MSLLSAVLQILTVEALRGQTVAGTRVIDNPVDPLLDKLHEDPLPILAVFSGAASVSPTGKDILGAKQEIELAVQIFLTEAVSFELDGSTILIDARNAGDLALNLVWRQVHRALLVADGPWAKLWREAVVSIDEVETRSYLFETDQKTRVHAREVVFHVCTLADPAFGEAPSDWFWAQVLDLLASNPDYAPVAALIRSEIVTPEGLPEWRVAQINLGLTDAGAAALGLQPFLDHAEPGQEPAQLDEITLDPLGVSSDDVE